VGGHLAQSAQFGARNKVRQLGDRVHRGLVHTRPAFRTAARTSGIFGRNMEAVRRRRQAASSAGGKKKQGFVSLPYACH
jgi:hypothetical protein